jgi:N utilization substance protein A
MYLEMHWKKKYGSDDNFDIIINPDKGDMDLRRRE